jgi:hypothetical protein
MHLIKRVPLISGSVQHEDFVVRRLKFLFCIQISLHFSHLQPLSDIFQRISVANLSMTNVKLGGLSTFSPSIIQVGVKELKMNVRYDYLEVQGNYTTSSFMSRSRG